MILWTFKLISSVRKAIAGRKHPGQLAWGVALGALLGMIPHGNLLAVALVLFVLMLQVNHAMVALVGIAVTFLAPRLDPTFDALGRWCFEQPQVADRLALAWQYPFVPWTDLNNTIVMGSFLIGLLAVGPLFMVSYPLFRAWAPADAVPVDDASADAVTKVNNDEATAPDDARFEDKQSATDATADQKLKRFDAGHATRDGKHVESSEVAGDSVSRTSQPLTNPTVAGPAAPAASAQIISAVRSQESAAAQYRTSRENSRLPANAETARTHPRPTAPSRAPRTTRVAIGSSSPRPVMTTQAMIASRNAQSNTAVDSHGSPANDQHKIDEALSYLLRQLRDSKDKDAA